MKRLQVLGAAFVASFAFVSQSNAQDLQQQKQQTSETEKEFEEIVVTGSRVVRDGYEAPTPLTVVGVEALENNATANVADYMNTMPVFSGSTSPATTQAGVSSATAGVNALNLRGLGTERTLVLLDGQRAVGSLLTGVVNINGFPQGLISRVDVVTGGASAAYGSDALSGVVNFILDKTFSGLKGEVSGGVTTYRDNANWKFGLTAGTPFAGGRGHVLAAVESAHEDGILQADREWNSTGLGIILNPAYTATNGQPERLVLTQVSTSNASPGGIITAGPLKGTAFGPGGAPYQFTYGDIVFDPNMRGGDWKSTELRMKRGPALASREDRKSLFLRSSYDVTDNVNVFAQFSWASDIVYGICCPKYNPGNITIATDNAFLPASVRARALAANLTRLTLGSFHADLPMHASDNDRANFRYVAGVEGSFEAFATDWTWDAYYQYGYTKTTNKAPLVSSRSRYTLAIDAVTHPTTGLIVCRSTLTDPGNGCVPFNVMGIGVNGDAALNYLLGTAYKHERLMQSVAAASMQGEVFDTWAGPVSLALGIEHRKEAVRGDSDRDSANNNWFLGNYLPTFGSYKVTEGFAETVVPILKGEDWAQALDLNAATRFTSYSTSGFVVTWKVGATYAPSDEIRFRVTRSRDIRAPNLSDLFQAGGANTNNVTDPFNRNQSVAYQGFRVGNPNLVPEKADTTGAGVVVQPAFVPGLSASFDFYNIKIKDALGTVAPQTIVDECFLGNTTFCNAITRGIVNNTSVIARITISPFNLVTRTARGFDIETSYRVPVQDLIDTWDGDLTLRFLATHFIKDYSDNGINTPTDTAGENTSSGPPSWRWNGSMNYTYEDFGISLNARGISSGVYSNAFIECTSGCPTSTVANPTISENDIAGAVYFDASLNYKFLLAETTEAEAFFNVKNIMNTDPVLVAGGPGGIPYVNLQTNAGLYDIEGRVFRLGLRFKM